jgi:hypothetical protein
MLLTLELCCRTSCLVQRMHTYCDILAKFQTPVVRQRMRWLSNVDTGDCNGSSLLSSFKSKLAGTDVISASRIVLSPERTLLIALLLLRQFRPFHITITRGTAHITNLNSISQNSHP